MATEKRIIFGAGGHGKVIYDLYYQNKLEVDYFVDESVQGHLYNVPIISQETLTSYSEEGQSFCGVLAIGNSQSREKLARRYPIRYETLVHPKAIIGIDVELSEGTVVMASAVINAGSRVGKHCIINTGAILEHDCLLGNFVHMAPGSCTGGSVRVSDHVHLGLGALIVEGLQIDTGAFVGAGAVVTRSVMKGHRVAGVPARQLE